MKNFYQYVLPIVAASLLATGCASAPPTTTTDAKTVAEVKPAAPAVAAKADAATISYNVVRGDHLWGIAGKATIYGNPYEWPLIFKANRDKIKDADLIEVGQVFSIQKDPSKADVDAAIRHAKTRGEWKVGVTEKSDLDYLAAYGTKSASK